MKKTILAVALAAASVSAFAGGSSYAAHQSSFAPYYAGVNGGMNIPRGNGLDKILQHGYNFGGFFGYRFNQNLRADLSFDWIRNNAKNVTIGTDIYTDKQYLNQAVFLGNVYYDVTQFNMAGLVPYVGAGLGLDHGSTKGLKGGSTSANDFAWQLGGGVNYDFSSNMAVGAGYRLLGVRDSGKNFYNNLLNVSLTYKFSV